MAYVAHVGTDLVGTACLEDAFHLCHVAETFHYVPVGDCIFASLGVVGDVHDAAVLRRAFQIADNSAVVFVEIAPDQGGVFALGGVVEELFGQYGLCLLVLGDEQKA